MKGVKRVEERKLIRLVLESKQKLATLSPDELMKIASDEEQFKRFITGTACSMTNLYVCFAYWYKNILYKMIDANKDKPVEELGEDTITAMFVITNRIDEYDKRDSEYREDFTGQYEYFEAYDLGLKNLGMDVGKMNAHLLEMFDIIDHGNVSKVKRNKYYLATVSYLTKYHMGYLLDGRVLPKVWSSLNDVKRSDFASRDDYRVFKKVTDKTLKKIKLGREKAMEQAKGTAPSFKEKVKAMRNG